MSHILAALLLGVLALLGGTPATAANALPVPGPGGGLVAGSAAHAAAPDTHASGPSVAVRPDDPARWAEAATCRDRVRAPTARTPRSTCRHPVTAPCRHARRT
ncbi:hypothetical protein OVA20_05620 [Streptomyces sp. SL294]|uniref:hypothetical protein n=1 Tax=Streptomyces sp. SL294 TaxID=2995144 RepID=UPI002272D515|nr:MULTISPECIES: hypothetical protein [unclassified Streptomyces]MCY1654719.1 hypothetical protein [Streptomyces sp. SL203]MCY1677962.1 hypothetical protein [Streptomyces sp. SL294]